jgi:hypothetical protein
VTFRNDTIAMKVQRERLAALDRHLRAAFRAVRALDPDWQRNARQHLADALGTQEK